MGALPGMKRCFTHLCVFPALARTNASFRIRSSFFDWVFVLNHRLAQVGFGLCKGLFAPFWGTIWNDAAGSQASIAAM